MQLHTETYLLWGSSMTSGSFLSMMSTRCHSLWKQSPKCAIPLSSPKASSAPTSLLRFSMPSMFTAVQRGPNSSWVTMIAHKWCDAVASRNVSARNSTMSSYTSDGVHYCVIPVVLQYQQSYTDTNSTDKGITGGSNESLYLQHAVTDVRHTSEVRCFSHACWQCWQVHKGDSQIANQVITVRMRCLSHRCWLLWLHYTGFEHRGRRSSVRAMELVTMLITYTSYTIPAIQLQHSQSAYTNCPNLCTYNTSVTHATAQRTCKLINLAMLMQLHSSRASKL
jgi:hypothetical protein